MTTRKVNNPEYIQFTDQSIIHTEKLRNVIFQLHTEQGANEYAAAINSLLASILVHCSNDVIEIIKDDAELLADVAYYLKEIDKAIEPLPNKDEINKIPKL